MPSPLGGASRLTIALIAAVAFALVLGSTYLSLCLAGEAMPPAPSTAIVFLFLMTGIIILTQARFTAQILDRLAVASREQDERDERMYAFLGRRLALIARQQTQQADQLELVTGEIPSIATGGDVSELRQAVEASDRDRDLQVAAMHDALAEVRAVTQRELRESMRWVVRRLGEIAPQDS